MQVVRLIGKLNAFHPEFHLGHASIEQVIELSSCIKEAGHDGDQYCVVAEADKFKTERNEVLTSISTGIVTITDSCQRSESPVECENICCPIILELCGVIIVHKIEVIDVEP